MFVLLSRPWQHAAGDNSSGVSHTSPISAHVFSFHVFSFLQYQEFLCLCFQLPGVVSYWQLIQLFLISYLRVCTAPYQAFVCHTGPDTGTCFVTTLVTSQLTILQTSFLGNFVRGVLCGGCDYIINISVELLFNSVWDCPRSSYCGLF